MTLAALPAVHEVLKHRGLAALRQIGEVAHDQLSALRFLASITLMSPSMPEREISDWNELR